MNFRSLRLLVVLAAIIVVSHSLSNMGGNLTLALATPAVEPVIDVTTVELVQKPVDFSYESRGFSWIHSGADLVAQTGTPVKPIMAGTVKETNRWYFGFGNHVIIDHGAGLESIYGHLSKINVEAGQKVTLNTVIGEVGSTGFSTGPHLHLEIHQNGNLVNPADMVPGVK
ncbi:M23 family metallopeptidase [Candidatus Gottesmanbacteria bacterium]|nr:M23 family metallopeptidase [Candidatus Gottesmanbacteria bacterium]